MKRVFVDTSAFFADLVAEDKWHPRAKELFDRSVDEGSELVTTNVVVFEAYTLLRKKAGRNLAIGVLDDLASGICVQARVEPDDEKRAIAILRDHDDKLYSFCDALSFVVMERLGIEEAIAFDRDFRSYGRFIIL